MYAACLSLFHLILTIPLAEIKSKKDSPSKSLSGTSTSQAAGHTETDFLMDSGEVLQTDSDWVNGGLHSGASSSFSAFLLWFMVYDFSCLSLQDPLSKA